MGLAGVQKIIIVVCPKKETGGQASEPWSGFAGGGAGGPIAEACSQVFLHLDPLCLSGVKRVLSKLGGVVRQCLRHGGHTRGSAISLDRKGRSCGFDIRHGALPWLTIGSQPSFSAVASVRYSFYTSTDVYEAERKG
jgi:hypothetical protein